MLRLRDGQASLWEVALPPGAKVLAPELAAIDTLLDDNRFLEPFLERFNSRIGRPTIPIETYLRLMYLKHRYGLGYETLVKEVADSLSWRRFCRLSLEAEVPHSTTLLKLTQRFGNEIVEELNQTLLKTAVERKLLRSRRLRVDTTVMEADVRYPTDAGLCSDAIGRLGRAVRKVKGMGLAVRTRFRNRSRSAGKVQRRMSLLQRWPNRKEAILGLTGKVRDLARAAIRQAARVVRNGRRRARSKGQKAALARLTQELERAVRAVIQTNRRLSGETVIPNRVVSLSDLDARPIRRGKPQKPTEFGYKVAIGDTAEGFVVAHQVQHGNPRDVDSLAPILAGAKAVGMRVRTVFADRAYGNEVGDRVLAEAAIPDKVIPRTGRAAPVERGRNWRRRYRFRSGTEGRISALKRRYGLRRSRLKSHTGAEIWLGFGVLANNLDRMVALAA
jgi:IS5 family transposase